MFLLHLLLLDRRSLNFVTLKFVSGRSFIYIFFLNFLYSIEEGKFIRFIYKFHQRFKNLILFHLLGYADPKIAMKHVVSIWYMETDLWKSLFKLVKKIFAINENQKICVANSLDKGTTIFALKTILEKIILKRNAVTFTVLQVNIIF